MLMQNTDSLHILILFTFSQELHIVENNKMPYGVICDVVHRLHQGVLYFKNWFRSTQVNINSLIPIRQYILPCTNMLRFHTILANA